MLNVKYKRYGLAFYKQEIGAVLLTMLAFFLAVSLFSYSPYDTSWFYYSTNLEPLHNLCGKVGAHCAALLFYFFGASSFFAVGLLLFLAYMMLFGRTFAQEWERVIAGSLLVIVNAALCSIYRIDFFHARFPGGFIGNALRITLYAMFDEIGTLLLLHSLLLICLILLFRFSFIGFIFQATNFMRSLTVIIIRVSGLVVPVARVTIKGTYYILLPCIGIVRLVKSFFVGALLPDQEYSTFDFDHELAHLQGGDTSGSEDAFWHEYFKQENVDQAHAPLKEIQHESLYAPKHMDSLPHADEAVSLLAPEEDSGVEELEEKKGACKEKRYRLPSLSIFIGVKDEQNDQQLTQELEMRARVLEEKLQRFGVSGRVVSIKRGPVVTLFEYQPNIDTKLSKILALEDDLALALQAMSIRILAPIPGRSVVGFEVANKHRRGVFLAHVVQSSAYQDFSGKLPLIPGEDTIGNSVIVDLATMPHLLIAGSTGSGKSVALNAMLISLLCTLRPDELRLILIDPKRLEFAPYADIAHLLFPIVTDPKRATLSLRWVVKEMEHRYEKMAEIGARSIFDYNVMVAKQPEGEKLPYIVVVIDELADLMLLAGRDIEDLIARITQMARAAGIHLMVATQRPSVDVITGLIKVNFPSRISFRVTSKIDSRTILDCNGADKLLGRGDMLFLDATASTLRRVHGAFVADHEIAEVVDHIKSELSTQYLDLSEEIMTEKGGLLDSDDGLYKDIVSFLADMDEISISLLQRKFRIGYNRSARIIEMLEAEGRILPADGSKTRKVIR